jgi:hypothetical protein
MTDLPPPDLRDRVGRVRRVVLAAIIGVTAAATVYAVWHVVAYPDHMGVLDAATCLVGGVTFLVTLKIANWRADKKYREQQLAQARTVRSSPP